MYHPGLLSPGCDLHTCFSMFNDSNNRSSKDKQARSTGINQIRVAARKANCASYSSSDSSYNIAIVCSTSCGSNNRSVKPLLMQSDLQSVGNGAISTFARAFAPKMCETAVSRLRMTLAILQDLSRAVSRLSRCPVARNHLRYFSDPTGSNTIKHPDWIGKNYLELFPASRGVQLHKTTFGTFPIQLGQIRLRSGIGSEKNFFRSNRGF